jgi:hypothetical protein
VVEEYLGSLKNEYWMHQYLLNGTNWQDVLNLLKPGMLINDYIIFFEEPFNKWIKRMMKTEDINKI